MKIIDTSMQAGVHPFLIDMAKHLDKHPETIKEVEVNRSGFNPTKIKKQTLRSAFYCKWWERQGYFKFLYRQNSI